jgi:hypothetical protein
MSRRNWTGGRIAAALAGGLAAVLGVLMVFAGGLLLVAHSEGRDGDGYYTTGTERLSTETRALTVEDIDLGGGAADALPKDALGRVRVRAERTDGGAVFIGIGRERDVDEYLRDVAHAEVDDLDPPEYTTRRGGTAAGPPAGEGFWVASAGGRGRQAVDWDVEGGRWAVLAMNSDASRGVALDADVAAKPGWILGVGIGLLAGGLALVAAGALLILGASRRAAA